MPEQYYKKVTSSSVVEEVHRPTGDVNFYQVTAQPNVHVAEDISLKPKQLHKLQQRLCDSSRAIGVTDFSVLPSVYVADEIQLGTNAPALYNWKQDKIFFTLGLLDDKKIKGLQSDGVLPENPLSTSVHELIHWQDATKYREKHSDMENYSNWIKRYCRKKVVALEKTGYNINVSRYTNDMLKEKRYDEVYTEIRTKQLLERGSHS